MSMRYKIVNDFDPNDSFVVEADTLEDAANAALEQLGWWIAGEESEDEE